MEIKIHNNQIWLKDPSKAHEYEVEVWTDQGNYLVGVDASNRAQAAVLVKMHAYQWLRGTGHQVASVNMTA
tara:strand:- start:279 stop:491 length:213 start_codon:yes stop_codon:yes gene_type:complete